MKGKQSTKKQNTRPKTKKTPHNLQYLQHLQQLQHLQNLKKLTTLTTTYNTYNTYNTDLDIHTLTHTQTHINNITTTSECTDK